MRGAKFLVLVLFAILSVAVLLSAYIWWQLGDTELGVHGLVALAVGTIATLLLGGGLMWLVFYSSKHGYDERAGHD